MKYSINQKKDAVFQLIKSMTGHEKRFFKLYARHKARKGTSNYIRMFDTINKMTSYEEERLKSSMGIKKGSRKFRVAKRYFYKSILESLRLFHADDSKYMQLKAILDEVHILAQKGLYEQALSELAKAHSIAEKFEYYLYIIEIINIKQKIIVRMGNKLEWEHKVENLEIQKFDCLKKIKEVLTSRALKFQVIYMHKKEVVFRQQKRLNMYKRITNNLLMKKSADSLPKKAFWHLYEAKGTYYATIGKPKKARHALKKVIDAMENQPGINDEYPDFYIVVLFNYIATYLYDLQIINYNTPISRYNKILNDIQKLEQFASKSKTGKWSAEVRLRAFMINHIKLFLCINKGEFIKIVALIPDLEYRLKTACNQIPSSSRNTFYYQFAMGYFGTGNYDQALHWINKLLNEKTIYVNTEFYAFIRLFNIIIHYELGNEELLGYLVRSTYRFLAKQQRISRLEVAILDFIRKELPEVATSKQLKVAFKRLQEAVQNIINRNPMEARFLIRFDLVSWLESKTTGKDFGEIVRAKAAGAEEP